MSKMCKVQRTLSKYCHCYDSSMSTFRPTIRGSLSSNSFMSFILLIHVYHVENAQGTANFMQILSLLRLVPEYFHPTLRASLPSNSFISFILLIDHVENAPRYSELYPDIVTVTTRP